jgi:CMD domain protein
MSQTQEASVTPLFAADDVINQLATITADTKVGALRTHRSEVARYAEGSYYALFEPDDFGNVSRIDRDLIALRVAALTESHPLITWHQERLRHAGVAEAVLTAVKSNPHAAQLSLRQQALLSHVDRLTNAPATATAAHIAKLTAVGLTPRDIVVISQLIAFLSFQLRTLVGLRVLAEEE